MKNSDSILNESDQHGTSESEDAPDREMTFLDHLEEFRWTVVRSVLAFAIGVTLVCMFLPQIGSILQMPLRQAYAFNGLEFNGLVSYKPMGVFSVVIQIAVLGGFALSMPFILYFIACFIIPGLTEEERKIVRPACFAAFTLFMTGVLVAYFFLVPLTYVVLVRLNQWMGQKMLLTASEHYNTVVWFLVATGVVFQFPLVLVILIYIQVLKVAQLKQARRIAFVGITIGAAFLTPTGDALVLLITTGILYGLYELSIIVGSHIEGKRRVAELTSQNEG